ncbi:MAG: hypothetical protein VW274_04520 [Thalassolituus sp.]
MIGEWDPSATNTTTRPTAELLEQLVPFSDAPQKAEAAIVQHALSVLKASAEDWDRAFTDVSDDTLIAAAFFYVRAEMVLPGFESGSSNPAIHIFRYLKSQGRRPDKDTVKALKAATDNRFIPHGDALA